MNRLSIFLIYTSVFLLSGCPRHSAPLPVLAQETARTLTPLHIEKFPRIVEFLEFDDRGATFIVAGAHKFAYLYDATTFEKRISIQKNDNVRDHLTIGGIGYIDDNTWYLAADDYTNGVRDTSISIRQIEPPREIHRHQALGFSSRPVLANKNHITHDGILLNWRDGRTYDVTQAYGGRYNYLFTPDSHVVTDTQNGKTYWFNDPVEQETMVWNIGSHQRFALSPDGRYAMVVSNWGKCGLWQLPQKEQAGSCGDDGMLGGKKWGRIAFQRDSRAFAFVFGNEIHVYATQPVKPLMVVPIPKAVDALALNEGRPVATDASDTIHVWDVTENKLLDTYMLSDYPSDLEAARRYNLLAFQPGAAQTGSFALQSIDSIEPRFCSDQLCHTLATC